MPLVFSRGRGDRRHSHQPRHHDDHHGQGDGRFDERRASLVLETIDNPPDGAFDNHCGTQDVALRFVRNNWLMPVADTVSP